MDRVTAAEVFVCIVERGSMAAAANALDMSRSMVTRYLGQMEDWAGGRLLHRSTRRLTLTPAGEQVLMQCRALLEVARDVPMAMEASSELPSGQLRISCSQFLAECVLIPVISDYQQHYPDVSIDLHISNKPVDLVEERIDLAIRITNDLDPNLIARPLGQCASVLCATVSYCQAFGEPLTPEDLEQHQCLIYSYFGKKSLWHFKHHEGDVSVPVSGRLLANESMVLLKAALQHAGITMQPEYAVRELIQTGKLKALLPGYQPQDMGIYGVYKSRKHMSRALRLMLDQLVSYFQLHKTF